MPKRERLQKSMDSLYNLNCITKSQELTKFGYLVSKVPLELKAALVFTQSIPQSSADEEETEDQIYFALLAACLSVENLFAFGSDQKFPLQTGNGDVFDRMFTLGAFLSFKNFKQQLQFCQKNLLRTEAFQEMGKIFGVLCTKYKIKGKLGKPSKQQIGKLKRALLLACIENLAVRDEFSYEIAEVNIFEFAQAGEIFDEDLQKNNLISAAKISKNSFYFRTKSLPQYATFQTFDLQLENYEVIENRQPVQKQKANIFLNNMTEIQLEQLLELAKFSPMLKTGNPKELKYYNDQILSKCEVRYKDIHVGDTWVPFPGKDFAQENGPIIERLHAKALLVLILRGDCCQKYKQCVGNLKVTVKQQLQEAVVGDNKYFDGLVKMMLKNEVKTFQDFKQMIRIQPFKVKEELGKSYDRFEQEVWSKVV